MIRTIVVAVADTAPSALCAPLSLMVRSAAFAASGKHAVTATATTIVRIMFFSSRALRLTSAIDRRPLFLLRAGEFLAVLALHQASEFGKGRGECGVLGRKPLMGRGQHGAHAHRRVGRNLAGDLERAIELLAGLGHHLDEAHA